MKRINWKGIAYWHIANHRSERGEAMLKALAIKKAIKHAKKSD